MSPYKSTEQKAIYDKVYHAARKTEHAVRDKAYRAAHKKQIAIKRKQYMASRKEHNRAYFKAYYIKNREKIRAYEKAYRKERLIIDAPKRRARWLQNHYGITQAEFDTMLNNQDGVCAICSKPNWGKKRPYVDHDHVTGKIRGILCQKCNTVLGYIEDDPKLAQAIIHYLSSAKIA